MTPPISISISLSLSLSLLSLLLLAPASLAAPSVTLCNPSEVSLVAYVGTDYAVQWNLTDAQTPAPRCNVSLLGSDGGPDGAFEEVLALATDHYSSEGVFVWEGVAPPDPARGDYRVRVDFGGELAAEGAVELRDRVPPPNSAVPVAGEFLPLNTFDTAMRVQAVYPRSDYVQGALAALDSVTVAQLALRVAQTPGVDLDSFRVSYRLVNDSVTALASVDPAGDADLVTVFSAALPAASVPAVGEMLAFSLAEGDRFEWPPGKNLLVDYSQTQAFTTGTGEGTVEVSQFVGSASASAYATNTDGSWTDANWPAGWTSPAQAGNNGAAAPALSMVIEESDEAASARCGAVALETLPNPGVWQTMWTDASLQDPLRGCEGDNADDTPACLTGATVVAYRDALVLFGGRRRLDEADSDPSGDMWMYHLSRGWVKAAGYNGLVPPEDISRWDHSAVQFDGRVVVTGGRGANGSALAGVLVLDPSAMYDLMVNASEPVPDNQLVNVYQASNSAAKYGSQLAYVPPSGGGENGRMLLYGGTDGTGAADSRVLKLEVIDITTAPPTFAGVWEVEAGISSVVEELSCEPGFTSAPCVSHHSSILVDDRYLVVLGGLEYGGGGGGGGPAAGEPSNAVHVYDAVTKAWRVGRESRCEAPLQTGSPPCGSHRGMVALGGGSNRLVLMAGQVLDPDDTPRGLLPSSEVWVGLSDGWAQHEGVAPLFQRQPADGVSGSVPCSATDYACGPGAAVASTDGLELVSYGGDVDTPALRLVHNSFAAFSVLPEITEAAVDGLGPARVVNASGGSTVTFAGQLFGDDFAGSSSGVEVLLRRRRDAGGEQLEIRCGSETVGSNAEGPTVTCEVPAGTGPHWTPSVSRVWSTRWTAASYPEAANFSFDAPALTGAALTDGGAPADSLGVAGGAGLTLTGSALGSDSATDALGGLLTLPPRVCLGPCEGPASSCCFCADAAAYSGSSLQFDAPAGAGGALQATVEVEGQTSAPLAAAVSYAAPSAGSWTSGADLYPTAGGATLNVNVTGGVGFFECGEGTLRVEVGGEECEGARAFAGGPGAASANLVTCTVPAGTGAGLDVTVSYLGQTSAAAADLYSYDPPSLADTSAPNPGNATAGELLTVNGANFGAGTGAGAPASDERCVLLGAAGEAAASCADAPATARCAVRTDLSAHDRIVCELPGGNFEQDVSVDVLVSGQRPAAPLPAQFSFRSIPVGGPPALVSVSGSSPAEGGGSLVVTAVNLAGGDATVSVGGAACGGGPQTPVPRGSGGSVYDVVCPSVPPLAAGVPGSGVEVTMSGVGEAAADGFDYDAPAVTAVEPEQPSGEAPGASLDPAGGGFVVLRGTGFGPNNTAAGGGLAAVASVTRLGAAVECASTEWLSATSVRCEMPAGAGPAGFSVAAAGLPAASEPFSDAATTYAPPVVTSVAAGAGGAPTAGGEPVTVSGRYFAAGVAGAEAAALVGGAECQSTAALPSDGSGLDRLECVLPEGAGFAVPVTVRVSGVTGAPTAAGVITYDAPTVASAAGDDAGGGAAAVNASALDTAGGETVVVRGANLGAATGAGLTQVLFGSRASPRVQFVSESELRAEAPAGLGSALPVTVVVAGQSAVGPDSARVSYARPRLESVLLGAGEFPTAGGAVMVVTADHMGAALLAAGDPLVAPPTFAIGDGGWPCVYEAPPLGDRQVRCRTGAGAGANASVTVTAGGQTSAALQSGESFERPAVSAVQFVPESATTRGGAAVTVAGQHFGPPGARVEVLLVGAVTDGEEAPCAVVESNETHAVCLSPEGSGSGHLVRVRSEGQYDDGAGPGVFFDYLPPQVLSIRPRTLDLDRAQIITVTGLNFGPSARDISVFVGGAQCDNVILVTPHTQFVCTARAVGSEGDARVSVSVRGGRSEDDDPSGSNNLLFRLGHVPDSYVRAAFIYTGVGILAVLATMVATLYYRDAKIVRASSPIFLMLMLFGAVVTLASNFFVHVTEEWLCNLSYLLLLLGFTIVYGSLLVKNYRILSIFNRKELNVVVIKSWKLMVAVGALVGADVLLLLPYTTSSECGFPQSDTAWILVCILAAYKVATIAFGVYVAYKSRVVVLAEFQERAQLAYAIYNITFSLLVLLPLVLIFQDQTKPVYVLRTFGITVVTLITLGVIFGPKFLTVYRMSKGDADLESATEMTMGGTRQFTRMTTGRNGRSGRSLRRIDTGASLSSTGAMSRGNSRRGKVFSAEPGSSNSRGGGGGGGENSRQSSRVRFDDSRDTSVADDAEGHVEYSDDHAPARVDSVEDAKSGRRSTDTAPPPVPFHDLPPMPSLDNKQAPPPDSPPPPAFDESHIRSAPDDDLPPMPDAHAAEPSTSGSRVKANRNRFL